MFMSGKRYSEEFKIEAVKQITERNYPIGQVSKRLGVTTKSLYAWIKRYSDGPSQHSQITDQQREIRDLKDQLKRTEEERDILKKRSPHILPESPSEICIYKGSSKSACYSFIVPDSSCTSLWLLCVA